jgi:hypothetical protein
MNKQQQRDEILKKRFKQKRQKIIYGNTINKQTFLLFIGRRCRGWWLIYFFFTQNCQQRDLWRSRSSTAINVAKIQHTKNHRDKRRAQRHADRTNCFVEDTCNPGLSAISCSTNRSTNNELNRRQTHQTV